MATAEQERIIREAFAGQGLPPTLTPGQIDFFVERYPELFGTSSPAGAIPQEWLDRGVTQDFLDRIGLSLSGFQSLTDQNILTLIPQTSPEDQQVFMQELGRRGASFEGAGKVWGSPLGDDGGLVSYI